MKHFLFNTGANIAIAISLFSAAASGGELEVEGLTEIVRKHFPEGAEGGFALLVTRNQEVIHSKGYGIKNGESPVTPQTQMGLASVSKQFAAMCAAILIGEGKLNLTDTVSKHLPEIELPVEGRELLVQDLVWHISGLPNFIKSAERESIGQYKETHGLKRLNNKTHAEWLATQPLLRPPGVAYEYTNSGYVLLARIVEVVSGKTYREFQQERILNPLAMENTRSISDFNGSGNMETTLEDYTKWDQALWNNALLDEETAKLLFKSGRLDSGLPISYGFGWQLEYDEDGLKGVRHGGSGSPKGNSRNMILRDLRNGITVAFFARENLKFNRDLRGAIADELHEFVRRMD